MKKSKPTKITKTRKKRGGPRFPSVLVKLATFKRLEMENGEVIKIPRAIVATNPNGTQIWILQPDKVFSSQEKWEKLVAKHRSFLSAGLNTRELFTRRQSPSGAVIRQKTPMMKKLGDKVSAIVYRSPKSGKAADYIHEFETMPTLWVDNKTKPTMAAVSGRNIAITTRGIEG